MALNEYAKKIAYFFHASLQATSCYPNTDCALAHVMHAGVEQGLLANGQCFTTTQLGRGLQALGSMDRIDDLIPSRNRFVSSDYHARKPSPTLFKAALDVLRVARREAGEYSAHRLADRSRHRPGQASRHEDRFVRG